MKAVLQREEEFRLLLLLRDIQTGRKPVDSLLDDPEFQRRGMTICNALTQSAEDAEDLYQYVCLKVWLNVVERFTLNYDKPYGNFYSWFRTVARNVFFDKIRKLNPEDILPVEGVDIADSDDPDARLLLREFTEFIKTLPESHQRAIILWLEGCSLREISEILNDEKINSSYGTVRNWIINALSGFKDIIKTDPQSKFSSSKQ